MAGSWPKWLLLAACGAQLLVAVPTEQQVPINEDDDCDASDDLPPVLPASSPIISSTFSPIVQQAYQGMSQSPQTLNDVGAGEGSITSIVAISTFTSSYTSISTSAAGKDSSSLKSSSSTWSSSSSSTSQALILGISTSSIFSSSSSSSSTASPVAQTSTAGSNSPYRASFTQYGLGDTFGTGNCSTNHVACGFFANAPEAAVSQNLFGVQTNTGISPVCGGCWKLCTDAGHQIVVRVNNLCPIEGNPLCSMKTLSDTNALGANVNFDLCMQSGATVNMFNANGPTLGTAEKVSCDLWSGHGQPNALG